MRLINIVFYLYYCLPHDNSFGLISKVINRVFAQLFKLILDLFVEPLFLKSFNKYPYGLNEQFREKKVIVSLTTFPARIEHVWIVIECLLRQRYKPDEIILWLSKTQFEGFSLPQILLNQVPRGLTIKFVEDDLKSHKKYIYAFDSFPNDYIITVDDDLYYDDRLIENLIKIKNEYPSSVVTNRCHRIVFNNSGEIQNYNKWKHNSTECKPSFFLVPTGGFGTLYSKQDLSNSYNDVDLIKRIVPYADDLWMKIQSLKANKPVVTNQKYNKDPITVKNSQLENLVKINVKGGGNDEQFKAALNYFEIINVNYFSEREKNLL